MLSMVNPDSMSRYDYNQNRFATSAGGQGFYSSKQGSQENLLANQQEMEDQIHALDQAFNSKGQRQINSGYGMKNLSK